MNGEKLLRIIMVVGFIFIVNFILPTALYASANEVKEIDIVTTPEKVMFDLTNMKPGDQASRTLKISNSGKEDFSYLFSAKKKSGSDLLYNALQLTVSNGNGELFKGSLGDFRELEPRELGSQGSEELTFSVEFPAHLGNEYQGLVCEVEFKFYAEGTLGGLLPTDNKLPDTATGLFNYLLGGIILLGSGTILFMYSKKSQDLKRINVTLMGKK